MKSESSVSDDCFFQNFNKHINADEAHRDLAQLKSRLSEVKKNPVMKEFLEDPDNNEIFYVALKHPTNKNLAALDERFKSFYRINRIIRYLSGFI
ncbi:hypothetical protein ACINLD_18650 [Bacillus sp. z60-11]|uniref:hypothetical protein n=1 Tax=Bacillus sp. z60-11 TaxID=3377704 RepID=UPI00396C7434